jgi:hypothetical protein
MPEFATVSLKEAQLRTASSRQGSIISEYASYIQSLPKGQAGRLRCVESENPLTIRRRIAVAANAMGISLTIKRSGQDVYFWREGGTEEQPRAKRRYTRRATGREETTELEQPRSEPELVEPGVIEEESPELGQTQL